MKKLILIPFLFLTIGIFAQTEITDEGNSIKIHMGGNDNVFSKEGLGIRNFGGDQIDYMQGGKKVFYVYFSEIDVPAAANISDMMDSLGIMFATAGTAGNADSLGGKLPKYYVDTATTQNITGAKTFDNVVIDSVDVDSINANYIYVGKLTDGTFTVENGNFIGVDNFSADSIYTDTLTVNSMAEFTNDSLAGSDSTIAISELYEFEDTITVLATQYQLDTLTVSLYDTAGVFRDSIDNISDTLANVAFINRANVFTENQNIIGGDSLWLMDVTGNDSLGLFNDGTNARFDSDNPFLFNNDIVFPYQKGLYWGDGDTYIVESILDNNLWFYTSGGLNMVLTPTSVEIAETLKPRADNSISSGTETRNWINKYLTGSIFNRNDECMDFDSAGCTAKTDFQVDDDLTVIDTSFLALTIVDTLIVTDSIIIVSGRASKGGCVNIAEDVTIHLPDAKKQTCHVWVDGQDEDAMFSIQPDGTVAVVWSVGAVDNADTDGNLCVYDAGTGAYIKLRLNLGALDVCYETKYKE